MTTVVKFLLFAIFMRLFMEKTFLGENERDTNEFIKKAFVASATKMAFSNKSWAKMFKISEDSFILQDIFCVKPFYGPVADPHCNSRQHNDYLSQTLTGQSNKTG